MIRKRIITIGMLCMAVLTACTPIKEETTEQETGTTVSEVSVTEAETEEEEASELLEEECEDPHDQEFYKELLRRLLSDEIYIREDTRLHYFSERVSSDIEKYARNYQYYICDVNGDGRSEIGIVFCSGKKYIYKYEEESDTLVKFNGRGDNIKILGDGKILVYLFYDGECRLKVLNEQDETVISIDYFKNDYGPEEVKYYINDVEVTEEQWEELFVKPMEELEKNAPQPFSYEELMREGDVIYG